MTTKIKIVSWNLKDFGTYDYSDTKEFIAETIKSADIVVIYEVYCDRSKKNARKINIGGAAVTSRASAAIAELIDLLRHNDVPADWEYYVTGANARDRKRDAYAVFYKKKPQASNFKSNPNAPLSLKEDTDPFVLHRILQYTTAAQDVEVTTYKDRRPGYINFKINNTRQYLHLYFFHASVPTNSQRMYDSCFALTQTYPINHYPNSILTGDFNANFLIPTGTTLDSLTNNELVEYDIDKSKIAGNKVYGLEVYEMLNRELHYTPCLGLLGHADSGQKTSIKNKWKPEYLSSAYDNILIRGNITKDSAEVINVIQDIANKKYSHLSPTLALHNAWSLYFPRRRRRAVYGPRPEGSLSCISDHLPVSALLDISGI